MTTAALVTSYVLNVAAAYIWRLVEHPLFQALCFYSWKWCNSRVSSNLRCPLWCLAQECTAVSGCLTSEETEDEDVLSEKTLHHLTDGKDNQEFPTKCCFTGQNDDKMSSCSRSVATVQESVLKCPPRGPKHDIQGYRSQRIKGLVFHQIRQL